MFLVVFLYQAVPGAPSGNGTGKLSPCHAGVHIGGGGPSGAPVKAAQARNANAGAASRGFLVLKPAKQDGP